MLGLKSDFFSAASMALRVFLRTEPGSLKYLETVVRDKPTKAEKSSIVLIVFAIHGPLSELPLRLST